MKCLTLQTSAKLQPHLGNIGEDTVDAPAGGLNHLLRTVDRPHQQLFASLLALVPKPAE